MLKELSRTRRLVAALALMLAAVGCAAPSAHAQTIDEIVQRGRLLVLIDTTNPPYGTVDGQMQPSGYEVELAGQMAEAMGVELEIVPVTSANRIPFLQTGKADILLSTLTVTPQRATQVMYTSPYATAEFKAIAPRSKVIAEAADLKNFRFGVIRGGATDTALVAAAPEGTSIQRFDDLAATTQALVSGQIDAIVENWLVPAELNKVHPGQDYEGQLTLQRVYFSMAVRQGSTELLHWINTYLFTMRTNGALNALHQEHLGIELPELPTL